MTDRLKQIRKVLGFNQTDFASYLGIRQAAYSFIESGKRPLAKKYIKVICSTFNVSEHWLQTGEGNIFVSSPYESELTKIFECLTPNTQECLLKIAKELLTNQKNLLKH